MDWLDTFLELDRCPRPGRCPGCYETPTGILRPRALGGVYYRLVCFCLFGGGVETVRGAF